MQQVPVFRKLIVGEVREAAPLLGNIKVLIYEKDQENKPQRAGGRYKLPLDPRGRV